MPKAKRSDSINVSGDSIDERGRLINKDIPEDARRSAKKGKKRKDTRKERVAELIVEEEGTKRKKRRKVVEDELPVKKRKKVVEEEIPKKKKKLGKLETTPPSDKALARLERRREKALNAIEYIPAQAGDEFDQQYRGMFDNLRVISTLFEEKMMENPSSRDVYALSTLYSQMREVIADIRSSKDVTQQIHELESRAYGAFLKLIGQTYIDLYFKVQKDIRMYVKDVDAQSQLLDSLQGVCKDQGDKVQIGYSAMLDRVKTVLM